MRNEDREPTEQTARRAVELWKRLLKNPKYDNGAEDQANKMAQLLAMGLNKNNTDEKLKAFGDELFKKIMNKDEPNYSRTSLCVDYGPDKTLDDCAKAAELKMEFPWKTNMYIYKDSVSVRAGYGAESENHYPLGDGRWLVTTLSGSDIDQVIEYVKGEKPLVLNIEEKMEVIS